MISTISINRIILRIVEIHILIILFLTSNLSLKLVIILYKSVYHHIQEAIIVAHINCAIDLL